MAHLPGWVCGLLVAMTRLPSATWLADCLLHDLCSQLEVRVQRAKANEPLFQMERSSSCPQMCGRETNLQFSRTFHSSWQGQGLSSCKEMTPTLAWKGMWGRSLRTLLQLASQLANNYSHSHHRTMPIL